MGCGGSLETNGGGLVTDPPPPDSRRRDAAAYQREAEAVPITALLSLSQEHVTRDARPTPSLNRREYLERCRSRGVRTLIEGAAVGDAGSHVKAMPARRQGSTTNLSTAARTSSGSRKTASQPSSPHAPDSRTGIDEDLDVFFAEDSLGTVAAQMTDSATNGETLFVNDYGAADEV